MKSEQVASIVQQIYGLVAQLEELFPGQRFTPDGHLVGSIGEALAAEAYGLDLFTASAERHDAVASDGRLVQIKATQVKSIALRSEPEHLLVLVLGGDGRASEVYNGPGRPAWEAAGKMQRNGQRPVSLHRLRQLMAHVSEDDRLRPQR